MRSFQVAEFERSGFFVRHGKSAVNTFVFTSILTKHNGKSARSNRVRIILVRLRREFRPLSETRNFISRRMAADGGIFMSSHSVQWLAISTSLIILLWILSYLYGK